jgi:hypothetical protein
MHNNMKRFEDQVAVITGGADGLGKGVALRIASEGGGLLCYWISINLYCKKLLQRFIPKTFWQMVS